MTTQAKAKKSKGKRSQWIMLGFFPLIAIGGLFYPLLGYLMPLMMAFLITNSYFHARYWCGNLCPRGAFLDIVMPHFTFNRPWPRLFNRRWFRWGVFGLFMSVFISRMIATGGDLLAIGGVFVNRSICQHVCCHQFNCDSSGNCHSSSRLVLFLPDGNAARIPR